MELQIRFTIQLKFIYSISQTLYSWPERGITRGLRRRRARQASSTCALAGLQHTAHASVEVGQGQSLEVVQQNCRHQKGFCTQVVDDLSKNHAVVFVEDSSMRNYVEVREGQPGNPRPERQAEVRLERGDP
jgi:hypothetical protein